MCSCHIVFCSLYYFIIAALIYIALVYAIARIKYCPLEVRGKVALAIFLVSANEVRCYELVSPDRSAYDKLSSPALPLVHCSPQSMG